MYGILTNLKIENNSAYCESILEFIITIYNELFKEIRVIKKIDAKLKIYEAINSLLINKTNYISFTNKIKFKLMDVQDKALVFIIIFIYCKLVLLSSISTSISICNIFFKI